MASAVPRDPTNVMGRRIVAYVIDAVLAGAVMVAYLAATKHHVFSDVSPNQCKALRAAGFRDQCLQLGSHIYTWSGHGLTIGWFVGVLAGLLDNVVVQGLTGASIGKMIVGLRVIDHDGAIAGMGRAFVRWLLLIVDAGACFAGLIIAFVTHPHRRVGDMLGGTYVVATADVGTPMRHPLYVSRYATMPSGGGWTPPAPPTSGMSPHAQPPPWAAPPPTPSPPTPSPADAPPNDAGEPRPPV